jgi:molybdate transport system ATP-binding protein
VTLIARGVLQPHNTDEASGTFTFADQTSTVLFGASGSGKTSILRAIAGLPSAFVLSQLTHRGQSLLTTPTHQRPITLTAQQPALFPHLSVVENLRFALKRSKPAPDTLLDTVIEDLGIETLLERSIVALSGGESQRVALARALLSRPDWLLLDEPLTQLDRKARQRLTGHIKRWQNQHEFGLVYVTHDLNEALSIADQVILIDSGRVQQAGDQDLLLSLPSTHSDLEGRVIVATFKTHWSEDGLSELSVSNHPIFLAQQAMLTEGQAVSIYIAERDVSISINEPLDTSILNRLPVSIQAIEADNHSSVRLVLALDHQVLFARITHRSLRKLRLQVGDVVWAQIKSVSLQP